MKKLSPRSQKMISRGITVVSVFIPAAILLLLNFVARPLAISPSLTVAYSMIGSNVLAITGVLVLIAIVFVTLVLALGLWRIGAAGAWARDSSYSAWRTLKWSAVLFSVTVMVFGFSGVVTNHRFTVLVPGFAENSALSLDPAYQLLVSASLFLALLAATMFLIGVFTGARAGRTRKSDGHDSL